MFYPIYIDALYLKKGKRHGEQIQLTIAFTRTAQSVTPFAIAKAAPLWAAGDAGRYAKKDGRSVKIKV